MGSGAGEAPLCVAGYVVLAGFACAVALQGGLPFPAGDFTADLTGGGGCKQVLSCPIALQGGDRFLLLGTALLP